MFRPSGFPILLSERAITGVVRALTMLGYAQKINAWMASILTLVSG